MDYVASLFDAPAATQPVKTPTDSTDTFVCCSRYRVCSDVGHCVIADQSYSILCSYRGNLESGRMFYGKNADGFSDLRYKEIRNSVEALSSEVRHAFDALLVNVCEYNRASWTCVVRNRFISEMSSVGLFSFRLLGSSFPPTKPEKWNYEKLFLPTVNHQYYGPLFRQAQSVRAENRKPLLAAEKDAKARQDRKQLEEIRKQLKKLPGEDTKEFLRWWLNTDDGIPLRDMLSAPYRMASLPPEHIVYAEELYRDTLLPARDSHIYPRSPWFEDGMLSLRAQEDEEERRIKLSPGYSSEEKEVLLAPIYQARNLRFQRRQKNNDN